MLNHTYHIVYTAIFAVLLMICSWISIPFVIPVTLQTFGVFLTILCLGGKQGTRAIMIYLLLGAVGIPAFSGFGAGFGYLLGNTGGYVLGFVFIGSTSWLFETMFGKNFLIQICSILLGLMICYTFGTFWFLFISMNFSGISSIMAVLSICVFPFIIPDLLKLAMACLICKRLKPVLNL